MKVHFGGSSQGYRNLKNTYLAIKKEVQNSGHKITRDWLNPTVIRKTKSLNEAFKETEKAIKESEAVILEASYDSSSLGKQMVMAHNQNLPILLLIHRNYTQSETLSQFISQDKLVMVKTYSEKNIKKIIDDFLSWVDISTKPARFNLELPRNLDNYLKENAKINKTSKAEEIRKLVEKDRNKTLKHKII